MKHLSVLLLLSASVSQAADPTAQAINNEGARLFQAGRYSEAEKSYVQAISIWRTEDGANLAAALNNLAALCRTVGRYRESEAHYTEALQIQTRLFGKDSIQSANVLNNLAQLHRSEGRFDEAHKLARKSVALTEAALGNNAPSLANRLVTLGSTYADLGQPDEALAQFERAAKIDSDQNQLASVLNNIAEVHISQHRFEEAEPLARRALAIWESSAGPVHPNVAVALNNIAQALRLQRKYAEAEPLYRRSLRFWKNGLAPIIRTSRTRSPVHHESSRELGPGLSCGGARCGGGEPAVTDSLNPSAADSP